MTKHKPYNFLIKGTVYPFDILVSVDEPDIKIIETLLLLGVPKESFDDELKRKLLMKDTVGARCVMLETNQTVIRVRSQNSRDRTIQKLVHELFHHMAFLFDRIGIKLVAETSDEAFAYYLEWVTREALLKLK